jgi:hypothetical protein
MARFLNFDNLATSGNPGIAGDNLINIDTITSWVPDGAVSIWAVWDESMDQSAGSMTPYIQIDHTSTAALPTADGVLNSILRAIESMDTNKNAVVNMSNFLTTGITITGVDFQQ